MKVREALNLYNLHNKPEQLSKHAELQKKLARPANILMMLTCEDSWIEYYPNSSLLHLTEEHNWLDIAQLHSLEEYNRTKFLTWLKNFDPEQYLNRKKITTNINNIIRSGPGPLMIHYGHTNEEEDFEGDLQPAAWVII